MLIECTVDPIIREYQFYMMEGLGACLGWVTMVTVTTVTVMVITPSAPLMKRIEIGLNSIRYLENRTHCVTN